MEFGSLTRGRTWALCIRSVESQSTGLPGKSLPHAGFILVGSMDRQTQADAPPQCLLHMRLATALKQRDGGLREPPGKTLPLSQAERDTHGSVVHSPEPSRLPCGVGTMPLLTG